MTKRQFWDRAYLRACSLPTSGVLSSELASRTIKGNPLESSSRKSIKPFAVFSKSLPKASSSAILIVTFGSSWILAGSLPSGKNLQPAASSSLLIFTRAVASFMFVPPSPDDSGNRISLDFALLPCPSSASSGVLYSLEHFWQPRRRTHKIGRLTNNIRRDGCCLTGPARPRDALPLPPGEAISSLALPGGSRLVLFLSGALRSSR